MVNNKTKTQLLDLTSQRPDSVLNCLQVYISKTPQLSTDLPTKTTIIHLKKSLRFLLILGNSS